ncbi:MAG: TlpA disulfide reductase family protein [Rhodothermales bacterium]
MKIYVGYLASALLLLTLPAIAQELTPLPQPAEELFVPFGETRTLLDRQGVHVEGMRSKPEEALYLPDVDTTGARYLTLYYSRDVAGHEGDFTLSILTVPYDGGLLLYADLNNDEDLRNDGPPQRLADSTGAVTFALVAPNDPMQVTHRTVLHIPTGVRTGQLSQAWFAGMMDEDGNLKPMFKNLMNISGEKGTFLFDERPVLARGMLARDSDTLAVGVFDFNVNGRYDDEEDLLLVDLDRDGRLIHTGDSAHVFKLNEVFEIDGRRYRLSHVDPYGRGVRFVEVSDLPTGDYLAEQKAAYDAAEMKPRGTIDLDSAFWALEMPTLDGDTLRLADLRGRPLLLNVWGEWCAPCRMEMPMLIEADGLHTPEELLIVGVLSSSDEEAARAYLDAIGATWKQVRITDAFRDRVNLRMYPTNLLVGAAGETAIEAGVVNLRFVEQWLIGR